MAGLTGFAGTFTGAFTRLFIWLLPAAFTALPAALRTPVMKPAFLFDEHRGITALVADTVQRTFSPRFQKTTGLRRTKAHQPGREDVAEFRNGGMSLGLARVHARKKTNISARTLANRKRWRTYSARKVVDRKDLAQSFLILDDSAISEIRFWGFSMPENQQYFSIETIVRERASGEVLRFLNDPAHTKSNYPEYCDLVNPVLDQICSELVDGKLKARGLMPNEPLCKGWFEIPPEQWRRLEIDPYSFAVQVIKSGKEIEEVEILGSERSEESSGIAQADGFGHHVIRFGVNQKEEKVIIDCGVELTNPYARLFIVLFKQYCVDREADKAFDDFEYTASNILADALNVTDDTITQYVRRIRARVEQSFEAKRIELPDDAVIETRRLKGYRLNPMLAWYPYTALREAGQLKNTTGENDWSGFDKE